MSGTETITERKRAMSANEKTAFEKWSPVVTTVLAVLVTACMIPWSVWVTTTIFSMKERIAVSVKQVEVLSERLSSIESKGSSNFQSQQALDNERFSDVKSRVAAVEAAVIAMAKVEANLAVVNSRLDTINARLLEQQSAMNKISSRLFDNVK